MILRITQWLKELRCKCGKLLCKYEGVAEGYCKDCKKTTRSR